MDLNVNIEKLKKKLMQHKRETYSLDIIVSSISEITGIDDIDIKIKYYYEVARIIRDLEKENFIKPCGRDTNGMNPKLYMKYKKIKEIIEFTKEEEFEKVGLEKLELDYYKRRVLEYREDKEILNKLNILMRYRSKYKNMTINEISYVIFGYEKAMTKTEEKKGFAWKVMAKIGLNEESIGCRIKYEPLLNTIFKGFYTKEIRRILIIENLETYWSMHKVIMENDAIDIDMIIWGQGYSCVKNFSGSILNGISENDNIIYFGDLDLEGVYIYTKFKKQYSEYNIKIEKKLYEKLYYIGKEFGIKKSISEEQREVDLNDMVCFLNEMDEKVRYEIDKLLRERFYIPQEALNYEVIKQIYE